MSASIVTSHFAHHGCKHMSFKWDKKNSLMILKPLVCNGYDVWIILMLFWSSNAALNGIDGALTSLSKGLDSLIWALITPSDYKQPYVCESERRKLSIEDYILLDFRSTRHIKANAQSDSIRTERRLINYVPENVRSKRRMQYLIKARIYVRWS